MAPLRDLFFASAVCLFLCIALKAEARAPDAPDQSDPHRNEVGFFDVHVCRWPNQPLFFMVLFSTVHFEDVESIEVLNPDSARIGYLDTSQYRLVKTRDKQEKRAFISQFEVPDRAADGWYQAIVTLKDGKQYQARDFIVIHSMDMATGTNPPDAAESISLPNALTWKPIAGAKFYQVFIRDEWEGELIYESELLHEAELPLPDGLLKHGGYYSWRIHARDMNENILLGDFNHGSLSPRTTFSVADD